MKKIFALLLALVMVLGLFGCGREETPAEPAAPEVPAEPAAPETPAEPEVPEEPAEPEEPEPLWEPPVYSFENDLETRQKALVAEAKAYYHKGAMNQYGMQYLTVVPDQKGGLLRGNSLEYNTPENNTKDLTLYQWCSSYLFDVAYNAFGYRMLDDHEHCRTSFLSNGATNDPALLIYQHKRTGDLTADRAAAREAVDLLQPGDFVTWTRASDGAGHTLMVADDMDGDGKPDILHRSGTRYNMTTGQDVIEADGIKMISDIEYFIKDDYLAEKLRFAVHRPALVSAEEYPITVAAQARMTYPDLQIDRTLSTGYWASVCSGETVTLTVEFTNHGTGDITAMPIMEPIPEGCTLVEAPDARVTERILEWDISVKAGETVSISYSLKVEGEPGDTIVFSGASYAGIASNIIPLTIQAYEVSTEKLMDETVQLAAAANADSRTFAENLYREATGKTVKIPTAEELWKACFEKGTYAGTYVLKEDADPAIAAMMLPGWLGGRRIVTEPNFRILETRMKDLQPGDIIVSMKKLTDPSTADVWVYDGQAVLTLIQGQPIPRLQGKLTELLSYEFFVLLRPSLAG